MKTELFINGEFISTRNKKKVLNPSTGKVITEISFATAEEIKLSLESARSTFDSGVWHKMPLEKRKEFLLKISQGMLERAKDLARLETINTGKPIKETTFMDVPSAAESFKYFAENSDKFLLAEAKEVSNPIAKIKAGLLREPLGVVVLIVPWNYPLLIASWKMAQALAAGNSVILKTSSLTPLSLLEVADIVRNSGVPGGVINIISGSGDELGRQLCSDKRVDMISFTGSNEVGRRILEYSSEHVKKSIMELGGKSASIILKDADLDTAVNSSLCSVFLNQGQMCTAMSRIFVEDDIYDNFIGQFTEKAKKIRLGLAEDFQTQMGPLISVEQLKKVMKYVEKGKSENARLLCGGKPPDKFELKNGFFFEPTVFVDVTPKMRVFKEEIFGPVVCIGKFSDIDEAVNLSNSVDFALAGCIWTKDNLRAEDIASRLNAGTVWVNTYGMFLNELPYGGFKQSGFGKELGKEGFLEYARLKNIIFDKSDDSKPLVNYWYGF